MAQMPRPLTGVEVNTLASLELPMVSPKGFREYDARWRFPEEINLPGMQAIGLAYFGFFALVAFVPSLWIGMALRRALENRGRTRV